MSKIVVPAKRNELIKIQKFIRDELADYQVSEEAHFQLKLAVEEIFQNIVDHAGLGEDDDAEIVCEVTDQDPPDVIIQFLDNGMPFDPLSHPDADLSEDAFFEREGGLGIFLVKKNMDKVEYEYKDNKNILTIRKMIHRT